MRKSTLLKIATTLTAMFLISGVFAQTNTGQWGTTATVGKYSQSATAPILLPASVNYTANYITTGKTMPFFVWPSAAYNPNWNPGAVAFADPNFPTQAELETNVLSSFAWRIGATFATLAAAPGGYAKNYVQITAGAAASVTLIEVAETAPAPGSCAGAPVYFGFTAVGVPTLSITNAVSSTMGLTNVISSGCGDRTGIAITATFNTANESAPYHINLGYNVFNATVDGSGNITLGTEITGDAGVPSVFGANGSATPSTSNPIVSNASPIVTAQDYTVENNLPTVYRFTYYNVNGAVSRKSDYIDKRDAVLGAGAYDFTYYPTAPGAGTVYYIVALPTPVTGPIYHIANNFTY